MKQSQKYRTYMYSPVESSRFMPMDADLARPAAKPLRIRYEAERCVLGFVYFWCLFWLFVAGWDEFQIKLSVCGPDKGRTWVIFVATGFDEQATAGILNNHPTKRLLHIIYIYLLHTDEPSERQCNMAYVTMRLRSSTLQLVYFTSLQLDRENSSLR